MGPSRTIGAVMPVTLSAPTKVVVFHAMWDRCDTAAIRRTTIAPRHFGGGSRLLDEHQPMDADLRLRCLPRRAFSGHVRPILLAGVRCFFERDVAAFEESPEHARHETLA